MSQFRKHLHSSLSTLQVLQNGSGTSMYWAGNKPGRSSHLSMGYIQPLDYSQQDVQETEAKFHAFA